MISDEKLRVLVNNYITTGQIRDARNSMTPGLPILFHHTDEGVVRGIVDSCYPRVFTLEDGRSFSYVDYILGSRYSSEEDNDG